MAVLRETNMWDKDEQLHWLRHMLGINDRSAKDPVPYRNYGAVGHDDPNFAEMAQLGWVRRYAVTEHHDYWEVTEDK